MLFSVIAVAQAAVVLGWPCQRLNWAWRNVWTTCGIQALVPVSGAPAGTIPSGFATTGAPLMTVGATGFQLDNSGVFSPGLPASPVMCATAPTSGGTLMRNRCRRMLDTYGNLVFLCKTPSKAGNVGPNQLSPVVPAGPVALTQPHADNAAQLAFFAQACLTPGTSFPVPSNTCPGLMGWFTVVWNACSFSLAPGWNSAATPQYTPLTSPSAGLAIATPSWLCGGITTPTTGAVAPSTGTPFMPSIWNAKGAPFKSSKCRRALDQFGRTSMRCSTAPNSGFYDVLRGLATSLGGIAPFCGI